MSINHDSSPITTLSLLILPIPTLLFLPLFPPLFLPLFPPLFLLLLLLRFS
jgi:hypothetical protein